jgi:purine nucleosidase
MPVSSCELCARTDRKVFAGADKPIARPLVTAEHVHGKTGLDGAVNCPSRTMPLQEQHAVDFIIETLKRESDRHRDALHARAADKHRASRWKRRRTSPPRVRELVMMGGGFFEGGNITPAAEFNIYVDPEAAAAVFASPAFRIVMMPLDVTHKVLTLKSAGRPKLRAIGSQARPSPWSRCSNSSSASTSRNTAPMAARCTIRRSSPTC